jgi:hypothetical protein
MQLIITLDTEADDQWQRRGPVTTENIAFIPPFQEICARHGFPPTYLCTHDVVSDPAFDRLLVPFERQGLAEIGAHLHPWTTPPLDEYWDQTSRAYAYASEIPTSLFRRKLDTLTVALQTKCGKRPTSYRAGRWGFSAAHTEILLDLGYVVDCSVTPLLSWQDAGARERGQDYREAPARPYYIAWGDPGRPGASSLVEVPVTVLQTNGFMRRSPALAEWYRRSRKYAMAKGLNRLFRVAPQWFRPFQDMTADRLMDVFHTARRLDLPIIQMAFHSSELMPGASPHNPAPDDVARLLAKLDEVFSRLARENVTGAMLSVYAAAFRASDPRDAGTRRRA